MVRELLDNQYRYRGILASSAVLMEYPHLIGWSLKDENGSYVSLLRESLSGLAEHGHLQLGEGDLDFLEASLLLIGHYWLIQSFPVAAVQGQVVSYNLRMIMRQLMLFATSRGRIELLRYKAQMLQEEGSHSRDLARLPEIKNRYAGRIW
ncbi:MAG: hypothetical protein U5L96_15945 [Owenweeksia sp.]|nr:hypothetical protein [Owenweeksia sp.]